MRIPLALIALVAVSVWAAPAAAQRSQARLNGANEVPAVSTTGQGGFSVAIAKDGMSLDFELTYSDLEGSPQAAHVHFGQPMVNGGIMFFLCGGAEPACPPSPATVTGTVVVGDILGPAEQGIAAQDIEAAVAAIRAGLTYVNVHTDIFTNGEIRGQIGGGRAKGNPQPGSRGNPEGTSNSGEKTNGPKEKTKLCHNNTAGDDENPLEWFVIETPATTPHLAHGDCAVADDAVVGDACGPCS